MDPNAPITTNGGQSPMPPTPKNSSKLGSKTVAVIPLADPLEGLDRGRFVLSERAFLSGDVRCFQPATTLRKEGRKCRRRHTPPALLLMSIS